MGSEVTVFTPCSDPPKTFCGARVGGQPRMQMSCTCPQHPLPTAQAHTARRNINASGVLPRACRLASGDQAAGLNAKHSLLWRLPLPTPNDLAQRRHLHYSEALRMAACFWHCECTAAGRQPHPPPPACCAAVRAPGAVLHPCLPAQLA